MKKKIIIFSLIFCMITALTAEKLQISGDIGLGYMNHTVITNYKNEELKENLKDGLQESLGEGSLTMDDPKSKDIYNALGLGLSVQYSWFYTNLSIGLPFKQIPTGNDPLGAKLKTLNAPKQLTRSVIVDWQFGGGKTLFNNKPLKIFVGGGLSFNFIRRKRVLPENFVKIVDDKTPEIDINDLTEIRNSAMIGIGIDLGVNYFFMPKIGVCLDLKDSIHFVQLSNQRYYKGTTKAGSSFTYKITKDKKKDIKSVIKNSWANNFNLRLGVTFKL